MANVNNVIQFYCINKTTGVMTTTSFKKIPPYIGTKNKFLKTKMIFTNNRIWKNEY